MVPATMRTGAGMWDCAGAFDQEITLPLWQGDFFCVLSMKD